MEKTTRGRKPLPLPERKKSITIFVKNKFAKDAYYEIKKIEQKYNESKEHSFGKLA